MICANCGKNNKDSEDFCVECGAAMPKVVAQKSVQKAVNEYDKPKKKTDNSNMVTTIVIIGLSIFLLIVVIAIVALIKRSDGPLFGSNSSRRETTSATSGLTELPKPDGPISVDNIYYDCYYAHGDYVFTNSSNGYLTRKDLSGLTKEEITIALQEIYARHGYSFNNADLQEYFNARSWYSSGSTSTLNTYEKTNVITLDVYLQQLDGSVSDPGNPYISLFTGTDGYAIYNSQNRYLEADDLKELTEKELVLARNEIFARHGYIFTDEDLQTYFAAKTWYTPVSTSVPDSSLNEFESNNVKLIQMYEYKLEGVEYDSENKYMEFYNYSKDYIFPGSSTRSLSTTDLMNKTKEELVLGRNEIFARNGYAFDDQELLDYFLMQDWYYPGGEIGDTSWIKLSSTDKENIKLIEEGEEILADMPEDIYELNHTLNNTITYDKFSIKTPSYWSTYAVHDSSTMSFYEKVSKENTKDCDGFLVQFKVLPIDETLYHASYSLVGVLTDSESVQYALYVLYPSDVRFHPLAKSLYTTMDNDISRILSTVTPAEGYTFTAY